MHDAKWLQGFRRSLLAWYSINKRDLPWRRTQDAYAIWVSEIMLQQTQVATVIEYYGRFLARFPSLRELAIADEQSVLALWSGLGYYRRARQMHAAAKIVLQEYDGEFPKQLDQVLALPGVGRYTAGAITSFAFDDRSPILEANTLRLFSRLLELRDEISLSKSQSRLWHFAQAILPKTGPGSGELNQAVMELGSLVCLPREPNCHLCPVAKLCPTHRLGLQAEIPPPKAKKQFEQSVHGLLFIQRRGSYLMRRNLVGEWWQGFWDFPRMQLSPHLSALARSAQGNEDSHGLQQLLGAEFHTHFGLECHVGHCCRRIQHCVTRFKIQLLCFEASLGKTARMNHLNGDWMWVPAGRFSTLPVTSTARKLHIWLARSRDSQRAQQNR